MRGTKEFLHKEKISAKNYVEKKKEDFNEGYKTGAFTELKKFAKIRNIKYKNLSELKTYIKKKLKLDLEIWR